ncbi:hypothetical protein L3i22_022460 [Actinoplanes sp. L3-i22]|nr:hypothetical protein L3i22_022460 [Actinoplanes sp. L3-i22]
MSNTYNPAKRTLDAMDQHAYAIITLRRQAEEILVAARTVGYTVDTAVVTMTAPASAYSAGMLDHTARETGALLNDLRAVVERARALDDATANMITLNLPSPEAGFGTDQLHALSGTDLQAQAGRTPAQVRAWWASAGPRLGRGAHAVSAGHVRPGPAHRGVPERAGPPDPDGDRTGGAGVPAERPRRQAPRPGCDQRPPRRSGP